MNDLFQLTLDPPAWHAVEQQGHVPCARDGHSFVYIPSEDKYFLFGGSSDDDKELNDLFSFDFHTRTWSQRKKLFMKYIGSSVLERGKQVVEGVVDLGWVVAVGLAIHFSPSLPLSGRGRLALAA